MADHPQPYWPLCPMAGASRATALRVDSNAFGDGYIHRSTRGLRPARASWTCTFPFMSKREVANIDQFLQAYAAAGFWFTPPDDTVDNFVTVDQWAVTISDKTMKSPASGAPEPVGSVTVTFTQSFNPQPITPPS